jgi:hypothetical protein
VSAAVAQALVMLGLDVSAFDTVGDLQSGVEKGERLLGYRLLKEDV